MNSFQPAPGVVVPRFTICQTCSENLLFLDQTGVQPSDPNGWDLPSNPSGWTSKIEIWTLMDTLVLSFSFAFKPYPAPQQQSIQKPSGGINDGVYRVIWKIYDNLQTAQYTPSEYIMVVKCDAECCVREAVNMVAAGKIKPGTRDFEEVLKRKLQLEYIEDMVACGDIQAANDILSSVSSWCKNFKPKDCNC